MKKTKTISKTPKPWWKKVLLGLALVGGWFGIVLFVSFIVPLFFLNSQVSCFGLESYTASSTLSQSDKETIAALKKEYQRPEVSSYLTFPEWFIVFSAEEYSAYLKDHKPSGFPYLTSIAQYWDSYSCLNKAAYQQYQTDGGNGLMLQVIGTSYAIEYGVKSIHENTLGRLTEQWSYKTEEDVLAYQVADSYGKFLHQIPWYEYPFTEKLWSLWREVNWFGPSQVRKTERRIVLSTEYLIKAAYGAVIRASIHSVYEPAAEEVSAVVKNLPAEITQKHPELKIDQPLSNGQHLISLPRYQKFNDSVLKLAPEGVDFIEIGGNDQMLVTLLTPQSWDPLPTQGQTVFSMTVLTQPEQKRVGISVPVATLSAALRQWQQEEIVIEHLFDY